MSIEHFHAVDPQARYLYFDVVMDDYHEGRVSYEEAVQLYEDTMRYLVEQALIEREAVEPETE